MSASQVTDDIGVQQKTLRKSKKTSSQAKEKKPYVMTAAKAAAFAKCRAARDANVARRRAEKAQTQVSVERPSGVIARYAKDSDVARQFRAEHAQKQASKEEPMETE